MAVHEVPKPRHQLAQVLAPEGVLYPGVRTTWCHRGLHCSRSPESHVALQASQGSGACQGQHIEHQRAPHAITGTCAQVWLGKVETKSLLMGCKPRGAVWLKILGTATFAQIAIGVCILELEKDGRAGVLRCGHFCG